MASNEVISVLNEYLTNCARSAVVRLRDPEFGPAQGIFTGFFISPRGHLLTAFHPLKHQLWDTGRPARFDLDVESDGTGAAPVRVLAEYEPGGSDFKADWALLRLDYAPAAYLPVAAAWDAQVDLCSAVRAYGFTEDQPGLASLGAYEGQYARAFPERSQFRMGFVDRGVGQSGGPVIDLRSRTVIGVVSGLYHRRELLTADAAIVDQGTLAGGACPDLGGLAYDWRGGAAGYLSSRLVEFRLLAADHAPPPLPDTYLRGRAVSRDLADRVARDGALVIHGARGSGKTSLAAEAAQGDRPVFWYDFDQPKKRGGDQLVPALALHLMRTRGAFEPLEQFAYGGSDLGALVTALHDGDQVLVFDNAHHPAREGRTEVLLLLERLARAAAAGRSVVLFTSWDVLGQPLDFPVFEVRGLGAGELAGYFGLYGLELSGGALEYIGGYADDFVCLEMFVRSAPWRAAVETGRDLPREPGELLSYWITRYLAEHVPARGLGILLALAVLEQPADHEMLEAVADAEGFHAALDLLRTSPPLVETAADRYGAHLNVRRAVLVTADKSQVVAMHRRAASCWEDRHDFAAAARHRLRSGESAQALALIRDHREAIIGAGRLSDLEALAEELLERARGAGDALYALHIIRASCSNIRGDYAEACRRWTFALRNSPDQLATAMLYNRRGDSYRLASEYGSAAQDYRAAQASAADAGPYCRELGRARLGLAKLDRLKGDYDQAREHYLAAQDAFEECFDEPGLIETAFGVGEVSRLASDWAAAGQAYSESLARAIRAASVEREAYARWGAGEVLRLTGDYAAAEAEHRTGLDLCVQVSDTRSEGWALLGLAETHRAAGELDSAIVAYQQAIERFTRTKSGTEIAHATLGWCEAERAAGRLHLDGYDSAERTYRAKELWHCLVLCLTSKAAALRTAGRACEADECLAEARGVAAELGLERELAVIGGLAADRDAVPSLALNFP